MTPVTAPLVPALRVGRPGREQLRIVCPWCRRLHHHGAMGRAFGAGDGHRAAHCADQRPPGAQHGYVLREVDPTFYVLHHDDALDPRNVNREATR